MHPLVPPSPTANEPLIEPHEPPKVKDADLAQQEDRDAASALAGGGALAGAATGAAIGAVVAGPVGVLVGGAAGAVAGALGGAAAGTLAVDDPRTRDHDEPRLHVEDTGGSGRAVVLIHGWPLSAQAWKDQVPALVQAGWRVVSYDRRGFGRSDKPPSGYDYDVLADDLARVIAQCGLDDATLVGFSMGGGEVARYVARHGPLQLRSVVFAAAVPPYLMNTPDNPEGPLPESKAMEMKQALDNDRDAFFDQFTKDFFSADGTLCVDEAQRQAAIALCRQCDQRAALACIDAFATTDFRADLARISVPTLVIHGDADAIVPLEGSGARTHQAIPRSELEVVKGAPHGLNVSHKDAFNRALLSFLGR